MDELTDKQRLFVEAYDGSVQAAAQAAGMSYGYARNLMTRSDIVQMIKDRQRERIRPLILTREQRQEFWTKVMMDSGEDMRNRLKASELLGKSEADFTEKVQHTGGIMYEMIWDDTGSAE